MTYSAFEWLLFGALLVNFVGLAYLWWRQRDINRLLIANADELHRLTLMLREFQRTSARPKIVRSHGDGYGTSIVRAEGLRYGSGDRMKFEW